MSGFRLSSAAARELDEIFEYILRESGPIATERVAGEFSRCFKMLVEQPGIGRSWDDLLDVPVRVWALWSYLIIYEPGTSPLHIARIVHGARDLRRLFDRE